MYGNFKHFFKTMEKEKLSNETIRIISLWISDVERKLEDITNNTDPRRKTKSVIGHTVQKNNKITNEQAIAAVRNLRKFIFNSND